MLQKPHKTYRGRTKGARNKNTISRWHLSRCEARALDAIIVFGSNRDAADYLGIAERTLDNQLGKAYKHMEKGGLVLPESYRARRAAAVTAWLAYWWSAEGKAALRNDAARPHAAVLTHSPLA